MFLANLETAVSIVQDLQAIVGETILVVGQGVVGLLVAEILSFGGMYSVISTDRYLIRRAASEEIGCVALDPSDLEIGLKISELTGGRGVDRAVNVSASPEGLQFAIDSLSMEGTVVEASWFGADSVELKLGQSFHRKRLIMRSSQVSHISQLLSPRWNKKRRMDFAVSLLEKIRPSKYITHTYPLKQAADAFAHIMSKAEDTIQVVLQP